jgi:hypothetical protein
LVCDVGKLDKLADLAADPRVRSFFFVTIVTQNTKTLRMVEITKDRLSGYKTRKFLRTKPRRPWWALPDDEDLVYEIPLSHFRMPGERNVE